MAACAIEGCGRGTVARGWCDKHWRRWRNHGDPLTVLPRSGGRRPKPPKPCSIEGCEDRCHARGWCMRHYLRWFRTGATLSRAGRPLCELPGCGGLHYGRGWCRRHYRRWEVNGDPLGADHPVGTPPHPETPALWRRTTPLVRADIRAAMTAWSLGRSADVVLYVGRAQGHGRHLSRLEREVVDGMIADARKGQARTAQLVAELVEAGMRAPDIARQLGVSERTVRRKQAQQKARTT